MSVPIRIGISICLGEHANVVPSIVPLNVTRRLVDELTEYPFATVLFVDEQPISRAYFGSHPHWQSSFATVITADPSIISAFELEVVPEWRWLKEGNEVFRVSGTPSEKMIYEISSTIRVVTKASTLNWTDLGWSGT